MRRPHVLLLAAALAAGSLAVLPAAPVPKAKPVLYFPVAVGAEWEYEWTSPTRVQTIVEVVAEVERKGGVTFVTFGQKGEGGKISCPYVMAVSGDGLHYGVVMGKRGDDPVHSFFNWELKLPAEDGDTWESDTRPPGTTKFTYRGVERVTVPAGEYDAHKVTSELELKDGTWQRRTTWYAAGVGKVKRDLGDRGQVVLKSFTPGKE